LRTQILIAVKIGLRKQEDEALVERTKNLSAMIQKMITYRENIKVKDRHSKE